MAILYFPLRKPRNNRRQDDENAILPSFSNRAGSMPMGLKAVKGITRL